MSKALSLIADAPDAPVRNDNSIGRNEVKAQPEGAANSGGASGRGQGRVCRGRSRIRQSEVARATRGLLSAASASGLTGNIEVHLESGVVKFCRTGKDASIGVEKCAHEFD